MKAFFSALCFAVIIDLAWAGDAPPVSASQPPVIQGEVLETSDAAGYTYLRLQADSGEIWIAVPQSSVKTGDKVAFHRQMAMNDFTSSSLHKTFPTIYFGTLEGAGHDTHADNSMRMSHAGLTKPVAATDIQVAKASGPDAWTVAEINAKVDELKDKPVVVRGQVVKYNPSIMGKNWIHLRDGTGSEAERTNDLLVTSLDQAKVGDVVTAKGIVRADRDFGYGYAYPVIVEEATLER